MKYALVTGGSRGIGRAICIQLARDGYRVLINYKNNHLAAQETLRLINQEGGVAELIPFDVTNTEKVNEALHEWEQSHPGEYIDVLVNNAGIVHDNLFLEMSMDEWRSVIDATLSGFYNVTRRVLSEMLVHHHGRIVNMSSIAGVYGNAGQVNYSAAKSALMGVTKSLAIEMASKRITVNAVAPGYISTSMIDKEKSNLIKNRIPMRRLGKSEEVADLVSFLVSEKASYITGQIICIDGGGLR